jgi:hypothetical protein
MNEIPTPSEGSFSMNKRADYKTLYHIAIGSIACLHDQAARALEELEELYLIQSEQIPTPEHLKLLNADETPSE